MPLAQPTLGRIYVHSGLVIHDCARGVGWLAQAAEQSDADAASELGDLYKHGECVAPNKDSALDWYMKAAEHDHPTAAGAIADIYLANADFPASLYWYRRAVKLFDQHAAYQLGTMYALGRGVRTDYKESLKWFELSLQLSPYYGTDREPTLIAQSHVREQLMPAQVAAAEANAKQIILALIDQSNSPAHSQRADALLALTTRRIAPNASR